MKKLSSCPTKSIYFCSLYIKLIKNILFKKLSNPKY